MKKKNPCAITPSFLAWKPWEQFPLSPPSRTRSFSGNPPGDRPGGNKRIGEFLATGYDTIKIKVGFDPEKDLAKVKMAQEAIQGKARIRIDANQGYQFPQAEKFVREIDPQGIEFFEQPLKENEWEAMAELSKISRVPLGLDESIYGMESVEKARKLQCCRFVKFKLMKIASAEILAQNIKKCEEYGFGVVLGNGATGEINCYLEALVAGNRDAAGEMNGFLKQTESVLVKALRTEGGNIRLAPDFKLQLDEAKVEKFAIDQKVFA